MAAHTGLAKRRIPVPSTLSATLLGAALVLLGCSSSIAEPPAAIAAPPGLKTGLAGPEFTSSDAGLRSEWSAKAKGSKASIVRVIVDWESLSPSRPAAAGNPADPAYRFDRLDGAVRSLRSRGLAPLINVAGVPPWARGSGCEQQFAHRCRPDPGAFGALGRAIARRYSGSFGGLPRARHFQAGNEPNLSSHLAPQWQGGKAFSPRHYVRMLNAFHDGVKAVKRSNVVVTAGTGPFGDPKGGERMRPLEFWRRALCLNRKLKRTCSSKARFDALSHHAINPGRGPSAHATQRDDAAVPDLHRIRRVLRAAEKRGTAPGGRHPLWVTEMWWESSPPDKQFGFRLQKQAAHIVRSMYEVWRDGARVVVNLQIRDDATGSDPGATLQAGLYFRSGKPKPALHAFRFPFLADRKSRKKVLIWGRSPSGGKLKIQRRSGKRWRTLRTRKVGSGDVFKLIAPRKPDAQWRAKVGKSASLAVRTN